MTQECPLSSPPSDFSGALSLAVPAHRGPAGGHVVFILNVGHTLTSLLKLTLCGQLL